MATKTAKPKKKRKTAKPSNKKGSKKGAKKKTAKKKRNTVEAKEGLSGTQTAIMLWAVGDNKKKPFTYVDIRKNKSLPNKGLSAACKTGKNSLVNQGYLKEGEADEDTQGRVVFTLTAKGKKFKV